ncbi:MAG: hypothetical protein ABJJ53_07055 [Sulfitobacter sp.]
MSQLAALFSKLPNISRRTMKTATQNGVSSAALGVSDSVRHTNAPKHSTAPSPLRKRSPKKPPSKSTHAPARQTAPAAQTPPAHQTSRECVQEASTTLTIPCPDPTQEERIRDEHQNSALKLVRQEDWTKLSVLISAADRDNLMTPGGMSVAELMTFGARADVVMAAEHALLDRVPEHDAPLIRGIEALEYVLAEHADDYIIGCIVAHAHMDLAWAWRGIGWDVEIAPRNREAFHAHFSRARDIMQNFNGTMESSALLAATSCALLRGHESTTKSVADKYEALIDLNPVNTSPMRALGTHMLPRWYGSYEGLELEARRTAARTQSIWGAGGYTWVMFDAISHDDTACARVDLPFFIEGLRDIATRCRDPHTINLLAAYCANTMGNAFSGNDAADANRAQIAECANWLVREHLTELHPMIWAHAAQGFVNNLRVASAHRFAAAGQDDALRIIAGLFKGEIADGKQIVFTDNGPIATPS